VGIVTARDTLTIHWSKEDAWRTVTVFSTMDVELARRGYDLGKDTRDWKVTLAQQDLLDSGPSRANIVPILYRPFDIRQTYYTGRTRGFICMPRSEVMQHMLEGDNLAMIVPRQHKDEFGAWATKAIGTHKSVAAYDINYYFPLYLQSTTRPADVSHDKKNRWVAMMLFEPKDFYDAKKPNVNPEIVDSLAQTYSKRPTPENIFHYIYAVLYSPAYRAKYSEFLRMDFPRIPFTADAKRFGKLAGLGEQLVGLHLLRSQELDSPTCRFDGEGDGRIGKDRKTGLRYDAAEKRVSINATQGFAPVPETVWTYRIGGYQTCEKWLKDRKERHLELEDIRTYCRMVTALGRTIELQQRIDALYMEIEDDVVEMTPRVSVVQ
jgi:predicted helicase